MPTKNFVSGRLSFLARRSTSSCGDTPAQAVTSYAAQSLIECRAALLMVDTHLPGLQGARRKRLLVRRVGVILGLEAKTAELIVRRAGFAMQSVAAAHSTVNNRPGWITGGPCVATCAGRRATSTLGHSLAQGRAKVVCGVKLDAGHIRREGQLVTVRVFTNHKFNCQSHISTRRKRHPAGKCSTDRRSQCGQASQYIPSIHGRGRAGLWHKGHAGTPKCGYRL